MGKVPKFRVSFLDSIQICRPNNPSTLVKSPLSQVPSYIINSKIYDISLPTLQTPPSSPHHHLHSSIPTRHDSKPWTTHGMKMSPEHKFFSTQETRKSFSQAVVTTKKPREKEERQEKRKTEKVPSCSTTKIEDKEKIHHSHFEPKEEPLKGRERRARTHRFKRYGSKDWKDGSTRNLENEPLEKPVARESRRSTMDKKVNESFVVVKRSVDPYQDFKRSMLEMIVERGIVEPKDLEQLLMRCLNNNFDGQLAGCVKTISLNIKTKTALSEKEICPSSKFLILFPSSINSFTTSCVLRSFYSPALFLGSIHHHLIQLRNIFTNSNSNAVGSTQDLSLQCYFRALHAGLVGAISFQYTRSCVDVVYFLQQFKIRG